MFLDDLWNEQMKKSFKNIFDYAMEYTLLSRSFLRSIQEVLQDIKQFAKLTNGNMKRMNI